MNIHVFYICTPNYLKSNNHHNPIFRPLNITTFKYSKVLLSVIKKKKKIIYYIIIKLFN